MSKAIVIIGGPKEETEEQIIKRITNSIYAKCYLMNKYDLDINKFKSDMLKLLEVDDIDVLEMLQAYERLSEEQKEELISSCTSDRPTIEPEYSRQLILRFDDSIHNDKHLYKKDDRSSLSEVELKRLIKRAKNPLERQALQRELSYCNYMSGKHKKGNKRKRRK